MATSIKRFHELESHLLNDEKPSAYFEIAINEGFFTAYPFTLLSRLISIEQSPKYHPEGNVWNHTMLVIDHAAKTREFSEEPRAFMWAALLHDLGKAPATKIRKGRITSYNHDIFGEKLSVEFLSELIEEAGFIYKVSKMIRWHMQALFIAKDLAFGDIKKMICEVNINDLILLTLCDRLGRGGMDQEVLDREIQGIRNFMERCREYSDSFSSPLNVDRINRILEYYL